MRAGQGRGNKRERNRCETGYRDNPGVNSLTQRPRGGSLRGVMSSARDIFLHIVPISKMTHKTRGFSFTKTTKRYCRSIQTPVPVLVREELKEAPELLRHAGVAIHERERGQQHLVSDAEETAEQHILRAKDTERLQEEEKQDGLRVVQPVCTL